MMKASIRIVRRGFGCGLMLLALMACSGGGGDGSDDARLATDSTTPQSEEDQDRVLREIGRIEHIHVLLHYVVERQFPFWRQVSKPAVCRVENFCVCKKSYASACLAG